MKEILSKDNSNIRLYQKLLTQKKYRREYNMFVVEGLRLCLEAAESLKLYAVFITKEALHKQSEALDSLFELAGDEIYFISNEIGDKISDTNAAQGIFAICYMPEVLDKTNLDSKIIVGGKYILLNNMQDPGNIGTIIRTAEAVGLDGVVLCRCPDLYSPKIIRGTMGSVFRLPVWENLDAFDVLKIFSQKNILSMAAVIHNEAVKVGTCDFSKGGVVVIGNEGNGLSNEIVNFCDQKITIKMKGNTNSLNAAMAAGIIMYKMTEDS